MNYLKSLSESAIPGRIFELLQVLFVGAIVFFLVGQIDYFKGVFAGSIVFVVYYYSEYILETFNKKSEVTLQGKISPVTARLMSIIVAVFVILFMSMLLTSSLWSIFRGDYCSGWAYSKKQCAIQAVKDRFETNDYYDYNSNF